MKKMMVLLLTWMLAGTIAGAQAETTTYEIEAGPNGYFACEDFVGEMTQMAQNIFGALMRQDDEVICGTLFQEHYRNSPEKVNRGGALMAVRRDGRILLMSANGDEDDWNAGIETDSFLPPDAQFSITLTDDNLYVHLTILYQGTAYEIRTLSSGGAYLYKYSWTDESGRVMRMDCYDGEFTLKEETDGLDIFFGEGKFVPDRLCAWTVDELPKTEEDIHAFERAHPIEIADDEAFISGVNLRERATGESASWGKYSAKVKVLGEKPGKTVPWIQVQLGDLTGWISGKYLHRVGERNQMHVYSTAVMVCRVGRARTESALVRMPDGEQVMQLAAGTMVHVLGERDGWLHVIVPRNELTWQTDWNGTYGFVKSGDMAVGISKADAMYKD